MSLTSNKEIKGGCSLVDRRLLVASHYSSVIYSLVPYDVTSWKKGYLFFVIFISKTCAFLHTRSGYRSEEGNNLWLILVYSTYYVYFGIKIDQELLFFNNY